VETSSSLEPGELVANRYKLERLIGRGGMGEVWQARQLELDAPVAIKFAIAPTGDPLRFVERFRREARALAQHRSPDLVQLYDVGQRGTTPFLVMELLRGENLKSLLERTPELSVEQVLELVGCVGRALSVLHRAGLVHRDVTPANIFVLEATGDLRTAQAKLLDLGIAKPAASTSQMTTTGTIVGSPAYMSPEQARAEPVDARSDLWSLAAVAFRALTGRDAFAGRSVTDVLVSICTAEIPHATVAGQRSAALDAFFERAFARNPAQRWASAAELVGQLERAVQGSRPEVSARPRSPRRLLAVATLSGACLGGMLTASLFRATSLAAQVPQAVTCASSTLGPAASSAPEPVGARALASPSAFPEPVGETPKRAVKATRGPRAPAPPSAQGTAEPALDPVFGLPGAAAEGQP
jgi:eukaryotic-like serine/threonine-protein kinase